MSEAPVESTGKVIDLMEALRASLQKTEAACLGVEAGASQGGQARRRAKPAARKSAKR